MAIKLCSAEDHLPNLQTAVSVPIDPAYMDCGLGFDILTSMSGDHGPPLKKH